MPTPIQNSMQINANTNVSAYNVQGNNLQQIGKLHQFGRSIADSFKNLSSKGKMQVAQRNLQVAQKIASLALQDLANRIDAGEINARPHQHEKDLMRMASTSAFEALRTSLGTMKISNAVVKESMLNHLNTLQLHDATLREEDKASLMSTLNNNINLMNRISNARIDDNTKTLMLGRLEILTTDLINNFETSRNNFVQATANAGREEITAALNANDPQAQAEAEINAHVLINAEQVRLENAESSSIDMLNRNVLFMNAICARINNQPVATQNTGLDLIHQHVALNNDVYAQNLAPSIRNEANTFMQNLANNLVQTPLTQQADKLTAARNLILSNTQDAHHEQANVQLRETLVETFETFDQGQLDRQLAVDYYRGGVTMLGTSSIVSGGIDQAIKGPDNQWRPHALAARAAFDTAHPNQIGEPLTSTGAEHCTSQANFYKACLNEFLGADAENYRNFMITSTQQSGLSFYITRVHDDLGVMSTQNQMNLGLVPSLSNKNLFITSTPENITITLRGNAAFQGLLTQGLTNLWQSNFTFTMNIPRGQVPPEGTAPNNFMPNFTTNVELTTRLNAQGQA